MVDMLGFLNGDPAANVASAAGNTFGAVSQTMVYIGIAAVLGALTLGLFYLLSFKHKVVLYRATNSGTVVTFTKAREFKTKEGVAKWRFLDSKLIKFSYPAPTNDFVQLSDKGKFVGHGNFSLDGTFNWRKISNSPDSPDSFTSEEKLMSYVEMRRAMEYVKPKLSDKLLALAPAMVILMILVVFMIFFGDVVEPFKDAAKAQSGLTIEVIKAQEELAVTSERLALASERLAQASYGLPLTPPTGNGNNSLRAGDVIPN